MYIYKLAYDRIPDVNLRSVETVNAMKDGALWLKLQEESEEPLKRSELEFADADKQRDQFNIEGMNQVQLQHVQDSLFQI